MRNAEDLVGKQFGYLTVLGRAEEFRYGPRWNCRCVCGKKLVVMGRNLRRGATIHCGCKREEIFRLRKMKAVFYGMHRRCYNPKDSNFKNYGGRGIYVCDRWENTTTGFERFIEDMGIAPPGKSIERVNNDGPYSPENCVWATPKEQGRNHRGLRLITFRGKTQCLSAWAEEYKINAGTLHGRLKGGWSLERALTTHTDYKRRKKRIRWI